MKVIDKDGSGFVEPKMIINFIDDFGLSSLILDFTLELKIVAFEINKSLGKKANISTLEYY